MKKIKVAIIGAGTAGLSARREVAKVTDDYVVIDPGPLGTTCARVGCMPSKVLIQAANDFHRRHVLHEEGIEGASNLQIDSKKVMGHVRKLRDRFVRGVLKDIEEWTASKLIQERARFLDSNTLEAGEEKIKADKIIIATGSSPFLPSSWKEYSDYIFDSDSLFDLEELPSKVAVVGLGVIGIELGQAMSRLGVEVIGIDIQRTCGGLSDPALIDYTVNTFSTEFPMHFEGAEIIEANENGVRIRSGENEWVVDKLFTSMGRRPNLEGLGLKEIGVSHNEKGIPLFDPSNYKIKDSNIYLVGDVNNERPILHEAADEGRIAGYNSVRESEQCFQRRTRLGIVFTEPNIATVGKTYQMLQDEEADFIVGKVSYEGQGRAIVKLKEKGLLHIYAHKKSGKILGAELFAPEGEHLAHLIAWAISLNLGVEDALALPFYHPVLEEGLRTALRDAASQIEKECKPLEVLRCQDPPVGF